MIYLLFRYCRAEGSYVRTFFALIIPDFIANVIELYIRIGADAGHVRIILILLAVAVVRSGIILAIYAALLHYGFPIVKIPRGGGASETDQKRNPVAVNTIKTMETASLKNAAQKAAALYKELEHIPVSCEILDQAEELAERLKKAAGEEE